MLKKGFLLLLLIPVVYLLLSFSIVLFIQHHSYNEVLAYYSTHWPRAWDVSVFAKYCLTPQWYAFVNRNAILLEIIITAGTAVYFLLLKYFKGLVYQIGEDVAGIFHFMRQTFINLTKGEKWLLAILFGLIECYRIYFFLQFPLHPDEAGSYLFFARQGPLMAACNYVSTNNHILLNVVCSFLAKLPFLSAKMVMRLPVIMGDLALLSGVFCLIKHFGNFARAYFTVAGVAFCFLLSYYGTVGRGYQWQEICSVLSAGCCWRYFFSDGGKKQGYGLLIASCVTGFYINPLFVYHFLALILAATFLFISKKDRLGFLLFVKAIVTIASLTFVLYLPLIMANSWNALVNNRFIHESLSDVKELIFTFNYIMNYGSLGVYLLPLAIIFSLFLYYKGYIKGAFYHVMLIYFVATIISFVLITIYQQVFPIERALCFWVLIIDIIFLNVLYDFFYRFFPRKGLLLFSILIIIKVVFSVRTVYWPKYSINRKEEVAIYNHIIPQFRQLSAIGAQTWQITDSDDYYSMFLRLYLIEHHTGENIILNRQQGLADVVFLPNTYKNGFGLQGYKLWKDGLITAKGTSLAIYVKESFLNK